MNEEKLADIMNNQIVELLENKFDVRETIKNYLITHRKEVIEEIFEDLRQRIWNWAVEEGGDKLHFNEILFDSRTAHEELEE